MSVTCQKTSATEEQSYPEPGIHLLQNTVQCLSTLYSLPSLHGLHLMDNVWYCLNGMQGGKKLWKPLTFHLRWQWQLHSCLSGHLPWQKQLKIHTVYLSTQRTLWDSWIVNRAFLPQPSSHCHLPLSDETYHWGSKLGGYQSLQMSHWWLRLQVSLTQFSNEGVKKERFFLSGHT